MSGNENARAFSSVVAPDGFQRPREIGGNPTRVTRTAVVNGARVGRARWAGIMKEAREGSQKSGRPGGLRITAEEGGSWRVLLGTIRSSLHDQAHEGPLGEAGTILVKPQDADGLRMILHHAVARPAERED